MQLNMDDLSYCVSFCFVFAQQDVCGLDVCVAFFEL